MNTVPLLMLLFSPLIIVKPVGMNIPVDPLMRTTGSDEGIFIRTRLEFIARGRPTRTLLAREKNLRVGIFYRTLSKKTSQSNARRDTSEHAISRRVHEAPPCHLSAARLSDGEAA